MNAQNKYITSGTFVNSFIAIVALQFAIIAIILITSGSISDKFEYVNNRIDNVLLLSSMSSGHVQKNSPSALLTMKGQAILINEHEFTSALYSIYDNNKNTYPENAYFTLIDSTFSQEKVNGIINKYDIDHQILVGIITSFYGGVKHGSYLEKRPFLK